MRHLLTALAFVALGLSGCVADEFDRLDSLRLEAEHITVPDGATLVTIDGGYALDFAALPLPAEVHFELPAGATMARFIADPGGANTVSVSMIHEDTGRRRCNQQTVLGFGAPMLGARSCSSVTAIDPPGTTWTARALGTGQADIRIELLDLPLEGIAAELDLSQLSHATYDLKQTQGFYVDSFDGTPLWVEVTLPDGPGPWPTVIAASPYNGQAGRIPDPGQGEGGPQGTPAMWTYWTQDYAMRGYAAVNVDVRGFGKSGGCVEVWGINEQLDQKLIVDWVAEQEWSDGNVGFYGQSYVGTTPVAAAVQAPEALKAIIAVAPVIDAYFDWHYGGVPNGESGLSPAAYQGAVDGAGAFWLAEDPTHVTDVAKLLQYSTQGVCDPTLVPLANDPRALHGAFFDERDFGARAGDVTAAVLYTQGFEDANVKSAMIPDWFNDITAPKLGVFGHWLHQHPARMDAEILFLGWMDQYVKGQDLGFDKVLGATITPGPGHVRHADSWPTTSLPEQRYYLADGALDPTGGQDQPFLIIAPLPAASDYPANGLPVGFTGPALDVETGIQMPVLRLRNVTVDGPNAMIHAALYADGPDGRQFITEGMRNLAHDDTHETFHARAGAGPFDAELVFRPTEVVLPEGSRLVLELRGVALGEAVGTAQPTPALVSLGADTHLAVPVVLPDQYLPRPLSAIP